MPTHDESDCVETVHGNKKMQSKRQQTEKPPNHKINYSTVHIHSTLPMHQIVIFHCFISSQKLHFQRSNIWFLINSHFDRVRSSSIVYNCHHTCSHTSPSPYTQHTHSHTIIHCLRSLITREPTMFTQCAACNTVNFMHFHRKTNERKPKHV